MYWILEGGGRCMLREQITQHIMMISCTVILLTVHGAKLFISLQHFHTPTWTALQRKENYNFAQRLFEMLYYVYQHLCTS